jgi:N-methylhydantoinase A/oxoprolinase/acetone carboxylase beta subunit
MADFPVIAEIVYNGRDNTIDLVLINKGSVLTDLSGVTRATIKVGDTTMDSSATGGGSILWWSDSMTYRGTSTDVLKIKLGAQALTTGEYTGCDVVVYDATNTNGLQVENPFKITVTS